jgi:hypothetical protein
MISIFAGTYHKIITLSIKTIIPNRVNAFEIMVYANTPSRHVRLQPAFRTQCYDWIALKGTAYASLCVTSCHAFAEMTKGIVSAFYFLNKQYINKNRVYEKFKCGYLLQIVISIDISSA